MNRLGAFGLYLLVGALLTYFFIDREEMKKHVPYGETPSIIPLRKLRIGLYIFGMLLCPIVLVTAFTTGAIHDAYLLVRSLYAKYMLWQVERYMKRLARMGLIKSFSIGMHAKDLKLLVEKKEKQNGDAGDGSSAT